MNDQANDVTHLSDEALSERLDATLDLAALKRVDAHLDSCAACAARYAGLQTVRVTLRAMRQVEDMPDFRLTAQGQPRRVAAHVGVSTMRSSSGGAAFTRFLSAAVTIVGLFLIVLALGSGGVHFATFGSPNADQSIAGAANHCSSERCNTSSGVSTTSPVTMPGDTKPTLGPTTTITPTQPIASTYAPATPDVSASPWPAIELASGVLLAISGFFTFARIRRR